MVKESKVYTTSDGKEYKTKKSAERHENTLLINSANLTIKEVDGYVQELAKTNNRVKAMVKSKPDWRDWNSFLVKQLPDLIEDLKNDVVHYSIVKVSMWSDEEKVLLRASCPRLTDGKYPKDFQDYIDKLNTENKDGSTFTLEIYKEQPNRLSYKVKEEVLEPLEKMAKGIRLTESDIRYLLVEYPIVYEVEGEDRRWSKFMQTVIKADDGTLYLIEWDKGLTEGQESTYDEQPKPVRLEEREVVTTVIDIKYM